MSDKQGSPSDDAVAPLRAIVVDDNPVFLRSASRLLASIQGVEVVGAVTSGKAALAEAALARPDLVLLDLAMPEMDGLEVTRQLSARPGAPQIIIMTVHDLPKYREVARASGVRFRDQVRPRRPSESGGRAPGVAQERRLFGSRGFPARRHILKH